MGRVITCDCGEKIPDRGQKLVLCPRCNQLFRVSTKGNVAHFLVPDPANKRRWTALLALWQRTAPEAAMRRHYASYCTRT